MTTPSSDKRAARRDARKADLANTQSVRRVNDEVTDQTATDTPEPLESETFSAAEEPVVATQPPVGSNTNARPAQTKTPTRPNATSPGTGARSAGAFAGSSKPVTRPTASGAAYKPPPRGAVQVDSEAIQTKRDLRRDSRRADLARVQTERKQRIQAAKRKEFGMRVLGVVLAIAVVALIGVFIYNSTQPLKSSIPAGQPGAGITCGQETTVVHYHAHLQFVVNGKLTDLPANVGISATNQCLFWLHVHPGDTGVIHMEAPASAANRVFTLGDFVAVWKQTPDIQPPAGTTIELTSKSFFGLPVDAQHPLTVFIDGKPFLGNPLTVPLKAHANIWVEYGTQLVQPTAFTFSPNE